MYSVCMNTLLCVYVHIQSRADSWQSMSSAVYPWSQVAVHAWKAEAEGSRLQDQAGLHTKFKANFNYIADCLKNRQKCTLGNLPLPEIMTPASLDGVGYCHYSVCL